ncbi:two-component regulator propeller domain-containing protein [Fodinibius sp. Rm-B-1B1-1]|uniref:two-component regulator propeller domain-containing protein n=1 Tax=Fodinibius alkaliphilus TaxID=3140241 RepID=UPI00315B32B8
MYIKQLCFGCICLLFLPLLGYSQHYNFKTYSVDKGLPQSQVHDIVQTQDGYIWMATYGGGLARFNGNSFTTYTREDGLKNDLVEELFVDSKDDLWVATDGGGVAKFEGDSLVYPIKNDSLNSYAVTTIEESRDGGIWFGTYKGGIFVLKNEEIVRYTTAEGLSSNSVWELHEKKDGDILIATANGMSVYDGENFASYYKKDGLAGNTIYNFSEIEKDEIWIATNRGISAWDGEEFNFVQRENGPTKNNFIYEIIKAADGTIWAATRDNGLFLFEDDSVTQLTEKNGLSSNYIYKLFEDADNNIWVGTDEDGANLYRESGFVFYNEQTGLSNNEILNVHIDEENILWMGTTSGIASFDGEIFKDYELPGMFDNNHIWNITSLPNGNKLVAMPDSTLKEFDGNTFNDFSAEYGLEKLFIYDLLIDRSNLLWLSTDSGLYSVNLNSHEVEHFSENDGLANTRVFHVYEDSNGRKWIGTYYGLSILQDGDFTSLNIDDGLLHSQVNYITEDNKGNIWIGTRGGVSVLKGVVNNEPTEIKNFTKDDGMVLLNTHFLWFDEQGYLWQGTNGGLQRLDVPSYYETDSMRVTHYPLTDEGIGMEFNFQSLAASSKKHAWMGGMKGVVSITPENMEEISITDLNITDIKANSSRVDWSQYSEELDYQNGTLDFPSIEFSSDKNIFEFTYHGISFTTPDNVTYRYKLEGFNEEWLPETQDNSAVFTNLDPGNYTFVVQARNSNSQWKNNQTSYSFSIAAPFWRTYWFYALIACSVTVLIYGYIQFRVNKLENRELQKRVDQQTEHLMKALEEKEVLIKEIHHRVKNNLAVISGLLELQMDQADNGFVNRVLSESQRRVQSISMIHEKLYQNERLAEINFERYVRELIEIITYSFSYPDKDINVNFNIDDFKLGIDQGIPCGLILNEVISNSFEHAFTQQDAGKIDITINYTGSNIEVMVEDNGKGLPENFETQERESLGITLIDTLSQQLQGSYTLRDTGKGTFFKLMFEKEETVVDIPT